MRLSFKISTLLLGLILFSVLGCTTPISYPLSHKGRKLGQQTQKTIRIALLEERIPANAPNNVQVYPSGTISSGISQSLANDIANSGIFGGVYPYDMREEPVRYELRGVIRDYSAQAKLNKRGSAPGQFRIVTNVALDHLHIVDLTTGHAVWHLNDIHINRYAPPALSPSDTESIRMLLNTSLRSAATILINDLSRHQF